MIRLGNQIVNARDILRIEQKGKAIDGSTLYALQLKDEAIHGFYSVETPDEMVARINLACKEED